jgi:hypothetical protein
MQEKCQVTYKRKHVTITADLATETIKVSGGVGWVE